MESSASKPHSSYFDSLFTPSTLLTPTTPSLNPADGGSFVHRHPGNNIKGPLGVNAEWLKNKTKLKNKEVSPRGDGRYSQQHPREGGEKSGDVQEEIKKMGRKGGRKEERKTEWKKEKETHTLSSGRLSHINHHLLNTQRCGLGLSWFNDNNKQLKKWH